MRRLWLGTSFSYSLLTSLTTLTIIAAITAPLYLVRDMLGMPAIALLYLLPVGLSAMVWGLTAGLTAAVGAFLTFNYFFIPPYYSLAVHSPPDLLILLAFFLVAIVISQLVGRARRGQAEAQAREHEATQLYELSVALAGLHEPNAIAHTLAEHTHAVFQPALVEVVIQADAHLPPLVARAPVTAPLPPAKPGLTIPVMAARGLLGEIHLWREQPLTRPAEDQLLRLFANQGALAIERALLIRAETQARVWSESDRLKSALLSSVSHELRTPLATIKAAATSLRRGEVAWESQTREELLALMEEEADQLNRLVGNLLDMSRLEAGALKLQRQWNLLTEIVEGALGQLRRAAEQHEVVLDISDDLPLVLVDTVLLQQVFVNLLSNSLKYAPPHTVVRVSANKVDDQTLRVRVSNQGPAVPPEHLEHIFDKFYRVTSAERVTGTGLGLSICKGIIEAHGGRIWAENWPDQFVFNLTLPFAWEGAKPAALPPERDEA